MTSWKPILRRSTNLLRLIVAINAFNFADDARPLLKRHRWIYLILINPMLAFKQTGLFAEAVKRCHPRGLQTSFAVKDCSLQNELAKETEGWTNKQFEIGSVNAVFIPLLSLQGCISAVLVEELVVLLSLIHI